MKNTLAIKAISLASKQTCERRLRGPCSLLRCWRRRSGRATGAEIWRPGL